MFCFIVFSCSHDEYKSSFKMKKNLKSSSISISWGNQKKHEIAME